jgi:poly(3-hydroxyalkanoate) synthetase
MPGSFDLARFVAAAPFWWGAFAPPPAGGAALGPEGLPNFPRPRLELQTLLLLEAEATDRPGAPTLIIPPYAVHDAAIADFAPGHSLARVLLDCGAAPLALVSWKSASPEMRDLGVDAYLGDLNVAVDDLGGRVSLVGLCQGGWLAALYAARFPGKVASLALAGAPLDVRAGESAITRALALTPPALIAGAVAMLGGRVFGGAPLAMAAPGVDSEYDAALALQIEPDAALRARFENWRDRTLALPGRYFLETTEWLFRENRLAENRFPALGRCCGLACATAPIHVLAAEDDQIVALPQATAAASRCAQAPVAVSVAKGGHLSLFMGRRTLGEHWAPIAHWLRTAGHAHA